MPESQLLQELAKLFYIDSAGAVVYGHVEGVSVAYIAGAEVQEALKQYIPQDNSHLR